MSYHYKYNMHTLPPEIFGVIVGNSLNVYDKLRATSKKIAAHLVEPPLLVNGLPTDVVWAPHSLGENDTAQRPLNKTANITRGDMYLFTFSMRRLGKICYVVKFTTFTHRMIRGHDGLAPIFIRVNRCTLGVNQSVVSKSADPRNVMHGVYIVQTYAFDIDILADSVYIHVSRVKEMLASGKWTF